MAAAAGEVKVKPRPKDDEEAGSPATRAPVRDLGRAETFLLTVRRDGVTILNGAVWAPQSSTVRTPVRHIKLIAASGAKLGQWQLQLAGP